MKRKNVVVIVLSVVVFVVSAALLYRYLFPPSPDSNIKVVIPHPVDPNFNQEQLDSLKKDVVDFSQNINPASDPQQSDTNSTQSRGGRASGSQTVSDQQLVR